MKWEALLAACAVGLLAATVGATEKDDLPAPWFRTGTVAPQNKCQAFVDKARDAAFDKNLVIHCDGSASGFVTIMQQIAADDYRGKRVRFAAQVHGEGIVTWAGLWMRVDGDQGKVLAFDNMQDRPLKGSFGWKPASVVLDVAPDAKVIAFGMIQGGDGTMYTGNVTMETVGNDVAATSVPGTIMVNAKKPANLSFSK
jgi:hypothetical protein